MCPWPCACTNGGSSPRKVSWEGAGIAPAAAAWREPQSPFSPSLCDKSREPSSRAPEPGALLTRHKAPGLAAAQGERGDLKLTEVKFPPPLQINNG